MQFAGRAISVGNSFAASAASTIIPPRSVEPEGTSPAPSHTQSGPSTTSSNPSSAISCLIALPFALPFSSTPRDLALLAFLGVTQLGLPCMLLVLASRALLAPEIALLGLLEVVLGPLWVWLGAGEVPAGSTLLGGMIVLAALAANELPTLVARPANCKA